MTVPDRHPSNAVSATDDPGKEKSTTINVSQDLSALLQRLRISLAFTSYQSGQLFMVGVDHEQRIAIDQQHFERAMGVHWHDGRLHLATGTQIIRFENMLMPGEIADNRNDLVLVPRISWTTNDVDTHELAIDAADRPLFVATKFNCIATVDEFFSFAPVWMPDFIPGSDKGDRCHLNGMAMEGGSLGYASMVATTSNPEEWREHRRDGGVIIDCRTGEEVVAGLSMPHSPRVRDRTLWFLEAGKGALVRIDLSTRSRRDVAFCPGFARGLALHGKHAIVTVSKPRDARFEGLDLEKELTDRQQTAWCGVLVIDTDSGSIDGWIRFDGPIQEMFDVAVLPAIKCPRALAPGTRELWDNVRPRPANIIAPVGRTRRLES